MDRIPKKIHYCWFGRGKLPEDAIKYIESWKKHCPDYEIKEWNEDNFEINSNTYVKQAYESKKFAFVTDYVRLFALYNEGGIYMDTDVELLKPLDQFLKHQAFSSFENNDSIPTGLMASEKGGEWVKNLLEEYDDISFIKEDGNLDLTTNVVRITNLTEEKYGLKRKSSYQDLGVVTLYPYDYFCPKDWKTGNIYLTENSYAIHHFKGSWHSEKEKKLNEKRKKYIEKYGSERGNDIFARRQRIKRFFKYLFTNPKKIIGKIKEKIIRRDDL